MHTLCAGQIKAARALLGWSQEKLAEAAGLSTNTIRNFETGFVPRQSTARIIRQALENAGMEFLDSEGIKRRNDEIKIYQGPDVCDLIFEDILHTLRDKGGELVAVMESREAMTQSLGVAGRDHLDRLERLGGAAAVKVLLFENSGSPFSMSSFQFRMAPMGYIGPTPYFVYGGKHALVLREGGGRFRFVVFAWPSLAHAYRAHFHTLWNYASSVTLQSRRHKQSV